MKLEKIYECRKCGGMHDNVEAAEKCCGSTIMSYFRCGNCGHLWITDRAGQTCCVHYKCDSSHCGWRNRKFKEKQHATTND